VKREAEKRHICVKKAVELEKKEEMNIIYKVNDNKPESGSCHRNKK